ncbi:MAG: PEGA domain-containing protein [Deltaproteobacteria bacterium]|nr:PEGA domain-containing protein [Deltaproteobacteria bacterium]
MKRTSILNLAVLLAVLWLTAASAWSDKGIRVIKDNTGRQVGSYHQSYALLIGVSNYTAGWPNLENIPDELEGVESALKGQGFNVEKVLNPGADEMKRAFEEFINRYGLYEDNRLLFFFSGHGHSRKEGKEGYIVPADAPDPRFDDIGFVQKAISMRQIVTWARRIESRHALFLFDSCFSGTVFKVRALPEQPPHISDLTARPVRQFITAGSAGETVPARSVFVPSFVRAIDGEADFDRDGYVTGTELGMFLHRKVLSYDARQTPQYGKIKDPDLDEGDFVFHKTIATLTPLGGKGGLTVDSNVDNAQVFLDGIEVGVTPFSDVPVSVGEHEVTVRKEGYNLFSRRVSFQAGRTVSLYVDLEKERVDNARLNVSTQPDGARVKLVNIKPGFVQGMELKPGSYRLEVSAEGWEPYDSWINLLPGEDKNIEVRLSPAKAEWPHFTTGNVSQRVGEKAWNWTVFIQGEDRDLAVVQCVEYTLHPTFPNPVRKVCDRGQGPHAFPLSTSGWGTFEIKIRVQLVDGRSMQLTHRLKFY